MYTTLTLIMTVMGVNLMTDKMTPEKQNKMSVGLILVILLFATIPMGLLGAFLGYADKDASPITGFVWGIGIAIALLVVFGVGMFSWEWIKKEADKGKLLPFILVGFIVAIAISGLLAVNLGKPSCEESSEEPYSSCISYADDGYEATSDQRWVKFWGTLPVTVIITSLVAVIVRNEMEKNKKK